MSTDLLRYDGSNTNAMTKTAAQTNSPGSIGPDHDAAMLVKKEGGSDMSDGRRTDKKSWEYLIKSGIAGGFAGCAVRLHPLPIVP
jgi:solute carrier family 25 protein 16